MKRAKPLPNISIIKIALVFLGVLEGCAVDVLPFKPSLLGSVVTSNLFPTPTCPGLPTFDLQLKASTLTAGTVNSWTDANSGIVVTVLGSPTAGLSDPDPKGGMTLVLTGSQTGYLSSVVNTPANEVSIFAVYKVNGGFKNVLTSNESSFAPAYFVGDFTGNGQGMDSAGSSNIVTTSSAVPSVWQSSGISYSPTSYSVFRNGSLDASGSTGTTFGNGIGTVFSNYYGGEGANVTLAELDIVAAQITSAQADAIHACAVTTYGVP